MSLKETMMKAAVGMARCIYAPMKLRKTQNRITVISRQSRETSTDIALLSDYMRKNHPDTEWKVMVRFIEPGIASKISYALHMISQMWNIAASKVILLDGYCICASILNHKKELKIIQMWHAMAAIKNFGYGTIDRKSGHSSKTAEIMCMHRNYDYVLAPSMETGRIFCKGFNTDESRIKLLGLPRIDAIKGASCAAEGDMKKDGREIILYAPTFRKGQSVDVKSLEEAVDSTRFRLVVKLHPLYDEEGVSESTYSTYEWLSMCDRVITDYSALGVEATLVGKPLYFYVYDIDDYSKSVGLNINPMEEMPKASAKTPEEMRALLDKPYDYEALKKFRSKYISVNTENCTAQLGDFIHELTC